MMVLYSPCLNETDNLSYLFDGEVITAIFNGEKDVFDFSSFTEEGIATNHGRENEIVSSLPINPVIEAKRENGVLYVTLLKFITKDATEKELFPEWIEV